MLQRGFFSSIITSVRQFFSSKNRTYLELIFVLLLFFFGIGFTLYHNLTINHWRHFSLLAESFLNGRTDIPVDGDEYSVDTIIGKGGRYFFGSDPLTAVFMIPFVLLLGHKPSQAYLHIIITIINIFLVNKILLFYFPGMKKMTARIWFILIFFFASSIVSILWSPSSWFLEQNLGILFTLWGLVEWRGKKRPAWLFLILFLLSLTKANMSVPLGLYFFASSFFLEESFTRRFFRLAVAGLGAVFGQLVMVGYYSLGLPPEAVLNFTSHVYGINANMLDKIKQYGMFNTHNIPTNIIYHFLSSPWVLKPGNNYVANAYWPYLQTHQEGTSLFFLGPVFFSLLLLPIKKQVAIPILTAFLGWAIFYLTYFTTGAGQFGSRYTAELIPFLFLGVVPALTPFLRFKVKMLILASMFLNMFLFYAFRYMGNL